MRVLAMIAGLALLAGCAGGDDDGDEGLAGSATTTLPVTTTAPATSAAPVGPAPDPFCGALQAVSTTSDPALLFDVYDTLETTAPAEIEDDVLAFTAASREVSDAFVPLGADADGAEVQAVIASLSPEARQTMEALADIASTGTIPEGDEPVAVVLAYGIEHCSLG